MRFSTTSSITSILKNPAYIGQARFGKTRVGPLRPRLRPQRGKPGPSRRGVSVYDTPAEEQIAIAVPALVDEALFAAVAEQLAENRQRRRASARGNRYLLQGLLVCGHCGEAIGARDIEPRPGPALLARMKRAR